MENQTHPSFDPVCQPKVGSEHLESSCAEVGGEFSMKRSRIHARAISGANKFMPISSEGKSSGSRKPGTLKAAFLSFLLAVIPAPLLAQDLTIYDQNQRVIFEVRDGKIYDGNQRFLGAVDGNRKSAELYDPRSRILGHVRDGKLYDKNWRLLGYEKKGVVYDKYNRVLGYIYH